MGLTLNESPLTLQIKSCARWIKKFPLCGKYGALIRLWVRGCSRHLEVQGTILVVVCSHIRIINSECEYTMQCFYPTQFHHNDLWRQGTHFSLKAPLPHDLLYILLSIEK